MKYFLSLPLAVCILLSVSNAQNCPPNIDFESGLFDFWECFVGDVDTVNGANVITLAPSAPVFDRHEIIDSSLELIDPYGGFLQACPYGGRYSVRLGNNDVGSEAEGISYTFQIPPNADTFALTYYYAVVFEDPEHRVIEQPRFFVSAYDVLTGNVINCASYDYVSNGSIPGFEVSPTDPNVLYKEWTPASIDFSGLAGRQVRLEFKTADCTRSGHFGYAYLDVGTGCGGVMAVGAYCIETNSVTLNAPYGFQNYTWYNANYTSVVATTRTVTLTPPPAVNSIFHVDMVPYPGYGCRDTADALLTVLPVPPPPVTVLAIGYCQRDFARRLTADELPGYELLWYTTETGGIPLQNAPVPSTASIGVQEYWVTQKKFFGCESPRSKITVTVSATPLVSFTVNDARQCENGNRFVFTNTSTNTVDSSIYIWTFGDGNTDTALNASHVYTNPGRYTVKLSVLNPPFCTKSISRDVYVIQKPVAAYSYPSVLCANETLISFSNNSFVPGGLSTVTGYWWQIENNIYTTQSPPSFTHPGGNITAKLVVTNADGCRSDTNTKLIHIHYTPMPEFSYNATLCENEVIQFNDRSVLPAASGDNIVKWHWFYNGQPAAVVQNPATILPAGVHTIKLQAESNLGCKWFTKDTSFVVNPKPSILLHISDSCVFRNINYIASTTTQVAVNKWFWNFGYGLGEGATTVTRKFTQEDHSVITLIGQTSFGCKDTVIRPFTIYYNRSRAEQDTLAAKDQPVQLTTSRVDNMLWYKWTPSTGLDMDTVRTPVATYDQDMQYELNTLTKQGCDSYSKILIKRFKGPELYVAGGFTPNFDRLNDTLHIFPVGIKSFGYFCIYNRDGVLLFKTTNYRIGWDGTYKGEYVDPGNYVWMAMAIDYNDKKMLRKGNVVLIR